MVLGPGVGADRLGQGDSVDAGSLVDGLRRDISGVDEVFQIRELLSDQTLMDVLEHIDVLLGSGRGHHLHNDVRPALALVTAITDPILRPGRGDLETAQSAIDTFISAFNASDDSYVTALLSQALTSDVVFWGPLGRSEGIEAVERFVLDIRRHPAGTGTMVRCSAVDMPDEWARYQWVFTTPDGGPRLAGTDVVHLRRSLIDQVIVFAGEIEPSAS